MATQVQRRGGTTDEHVKFTGARRETTIDTDKNTVVVHDGETQGGFALAREDLSNVSTVDLLDRLSVSEENIADFLSDCKDRIIAKVSTLVGKGKHIVSVVKKEVLAALSHDDQFIHPVGSVLAYAGQIPPNGFLLLNGQTIGANDSSADHADDNCKALFTLLWENLNAASLIISDGKGESSDADWQALKSIALPDARGRSLIGFGQGGQLTQRTLGGCGGEEQHQLTVNEMPSHTHSLRTCRGSDHGGWILAEVADIGDPNTEGTLNSNAAGSNASHNNMPPWLALNWIIKY